MVTAANEVMHVGQTPPPLTWTGTSTCVVGTAPVLSTTATATSPAGTYPINVAAGSLNCPGGVTGVAGTMTVLSGTEALRGIT